MKLQKIILCVAVTLTAFGVSLGLLEIGRYLGSVFQPLKAEVKTIKPIPSPSVVYPQPVVEFKQPVGVGDGEGVVEIDESEKDEIAAWRISGVYFIVDKKPKGFADFDELWITASRYDVEKKESFPIKPYGAVQTTKEFKFTWINITGKHVSFVTQTLKGISYQFDGKLVDEEEIHKTKGGDEYTTYISLKGRLTKWLNGKKIAEAKVRFEIGGGC